MERATKLIFTPTAINSSRRQGGFSMIEIVVVIAIIAVISMLAYPSVSSYFRLSLQSSTRDLAGLVNQTYNAATMTGLVHRIAYDLDQSVYWVEYGSNKVLLETAEAVADKSERQREEDEKKKPKFSPSPLVSKKKGLPVGVRFKDVVTQQSEEPITTGIAYTHFFPHGVTEKTIIHLVDQQDNEISLVVSSTVGRTRLFRKYVEEDEAFGF